ncbi:decarboxylase [Candidatus Woesearchaeota archaeon]|nr:decarboxylase [Candidatus Woesearchaeota archaeon]
MKPYADVIAYSSKTNPAITPTLEKHSDAMFSIHFKAELRHVQDKSRVLYFAQAWAEEDIASLISQGVRWFTVDNEEDLKALLHYLESQDQKINLLLRMRLKERTLKTERYYVFGMPAERVAELVHELRDHPKIAKLGIHSHRKTQNMAEWSLAYEFQRTFDESVLAKIDLVNIGGGLPSHYANTNKDVIQTVLAKIANMKEYVNANDCQLMLEPGRFISAPACKLVTNILQVHGQTIVVDASVYQGDTDAFVVPAKLLVEGELQKGEGKAFIIKGVTPCSMDLFRYRVYLDSPKKGDTLTFLNAGAYNFTTDFCDLPVLETELLG